MKLTSAITLPTGFPSFPCLAIIRKPQVEDSQNFTVLFTSLKGGTCVAGDPREIGKRGEDWIPVNSDYWTILPAGSKVTITVE